MILRWRLYRWWQRLLHRFDLHHMPPKRIEGDLLRWCHWCGLRVSERTIVNQEFPIR